jgi:hypothetical protein
MNEQTITVRDLIRRINVALQTMSHANPHRALLIHCGKALVELATRTGTPDDAPILHKSEETVQ